MTSSDIVAPFMTFAMRVSQMSQTILRRGFAGFAPSGDETIDSMKVFVGPLGFEPRTNGL